jgi:O-antigen/teichoic acid export membrane protein
MLKANIFAGYISQLYVMVVSILCIPIYIQYLGVASYGLVGFFAAIQGWFSLVDMGLMPAIARESSKYQAGAISALDFRRIYRILTAIFVLIAVFVGAVLWFQANNIVENWLKIDGIEVWQVKYSVQAMSICIALRWFGGLYKGVLTGAEKLVSLGIFNIGIGTVRYFGVISAMFVYGATPTVFFTYQLIIAGLEVVGLFLLNQKFVPAINGGEIIGWSLKPISNIFKFSATISFATFIWVANTQSDRLVLSGVLSLVNYGYFTSAVLIASGINLLTAPISTSLMPSLTRLHAQNNINQYISLYRAATQWVVIIAGSAAAVLVFLGHQIIYAWSGSNAQVLYVNRDA